MINWKYVTIGLAVLILPIIFGIDSGTMMGFAVLFGWFILPMIVGGRIALSRNRTSEKAIVVCLLLGWIGTLAIWLGLKTKVEREDGSVFYK